MPGKFTKGKNKNAKGKGKKSLVEDDHKTDGVSLGGKRDKSDAGGAGFFNEIVFGIILLTFILTTALFLVDYKQGQVAQLSFTLPPAVQDFGKKVDIAAFAVTENVKQVVAEALIKAEELSKKVPLGEDRTLADVIFNTKEKVLLIMKFK